jgi:hypothetical protein
MTFLDRLTQKELQALNLDDVATRLASRIKTAAAN